MGWWPFRTVGLVGKVVPVAFWIYQMKEIPMSQVALRFGIDLLSNETESACRHRNSGNESKEVAGDEEGNEDKEDPEVS